MHCSNSPWFLSSMLQNHNLYWLEGQRQQRQPNTWKMPPQVIHHSDLEMYHYPSKTLDLHLKLHCGYTHTPRTAAIQGQLTTTFTSTIRDGQLNAGLACEAHIPWMNKKCQTFCLITLLWSYLEAFPTSNILYKHNFNGAIVMVIISRQLFSCYVAHNVSLNSGSLLVFAKYAPTHLVLIAILMQE